MGEEVEDEEEVGELWFPLLLSHKEVIHSSKGSGSSMSRQSLDSLDGQELDQSIQHGSERQNTEEEEAQLHSLTSFKMLTSAIFSLTAQCFSLLQTIINCAQYWRNKCTAFVYMETQQHSWKALINRAQHESQCRCLPKKRSAAHSGWQTGGHARLCGCNVLILKLIKSKALLLCLLTLRNL